MLRPVRPLEAQTVANATLRVVRLFALPDGLADLAADAQADGHRMVDVLREDWEAGTQRFDQPGEALFAALRGSTLAGICGLTRDPYLAGAVVGRVRRLYVRRSARGFGAGAALITAVAECATQHGFPRLRVRAPQTSFRFYAACGFLRLVGEGGATHALSLASGAAGEQGVDRHG